MKLVITLQTDRTNTNTLTVIGLSRAARIRGHEVIIFLMSAGITNLSDQEFLSLRDEGVKLSVCEHNRAQFGLPKNIEGIDYESQYEFSTYVADGDRTIGFMVS